MYLQQTVTLIFYNFVLNLNLCWPPHTELRTLFKVVNPKFFPLICCLKHVGRLFSHSMGGLLRTLDTPVATELEIPQGRQVAKILAYSVASAKVSNDSPFSCELPSRKFFHSVEQS